MEIRSELRNSLVLRQVARVIRYGRRQLIGETTPNGSTARIVEMSEDEFENCWPDAVSAILKGDSIQVVVRDQDGCIKHVIGSSHEEFLPEEDDGVDDDFHTELHPNGWTQSPSRWLR